MKISLKRSLFRDQISSLFNYIFILIVTFPCDIHRTLRAERTALSIPCETSKASTQGGRQKISGLEGFIVIRTTMLVSSVWLPLSRFLFIVLTLLISLHLLAPDLSPMSRDRCPPLWIPQTPLVLLAISTEGKEILIHGGACYSRHAVIYSDPSRENQPRTSVTEFLLHLILIYPNKYLLIPLSLLSPLTESRNAASYRHSLHRDNRDSAGIAGSSMIAS